MDNPLFSTQKLLQGLMKLGQYLLIFPVSGLDGTNCRSIKFSWTSWRSITDLVGLWFFGCAFINCLIFFFIAKKWRTVMEECEELDITMKYYQYPKTIEKYIKVTIATIFITAIIEHLLSLKQLAVGIERNNIWDTLKNFWELQSSHIFKVIPYNLPLGILCQLLSFFPTMCWNYADVFLMVTSMVLSSKFGQVVTKLRLMLKYRIKPIESWKAIREDYNRISLLCKTMESEVLTYLTTISFTNNLFIILKQFSYTVTSSKMESLDKKVYFAYSFSFLIIRTVLVTLFMSEVFNKSTEPVEILNSLPSDLYNIEVERFLIQIKVDPPCLSGLKLFKVSNSLLIKMTGAIMTYLLITIHFLKL